MTVSKDKIPGVPFYIRTVELAVSRDHRDTKTEKAWTDELTLKGLDLSFEVERNDGSASDKATIKVANLSEKSRSFVEAKGNKARLSAGYGNNPGLLFTGTITRIVNERNGPDIITTLECSDGGEELRQGRVDFTFNPGTTDVQVLEHALETLREKGIGRGQVDKVTPQQYTRGYTYSGPVKDLLTEVCSKRGLIWRIENGIVEVLQKDKAGFTTGFVLSAETGLVGFPSKKDGLLTAKALLNPRLGPNRKFKLRSLQTSLNGVYVVSKAKFSGDTGQGDFIVEIEGRHVTS